MADVRLIDANALKKEMVEVEIVTPPHNHHCSELVVFGYDIDDAPTIDAMPVVHGRWRRIVVDRRHQIEGDECSACGFVYGGLGIVYFRYCPNCGAKMDGGAE